MRPDQAHPVPGPAGISSTACNARHASPSTEIPNAGTRTPERDPKTPENPLSGCQEGCLT